MIGRHGPDAGGLREGRFRGKQQPAAQLCAQRLDSLQLETHGGEETQPGAVQGCRGQEGLSEGDCGDAREMQAISELAAPGASGSTIGRRRLVCYQLRGARSMILFRDSPELHSLHGVIHLL